MHGFTVTLVFLVVLLSSCTSQAHLEQRVFQVEKRIEALENPTSPPRRGIVHRDHPSAPERIVHDVEFVLGEDRLAEGDLLEVLSVRGDRSTFEVGGTYQVHGRYRLASREKARLSLSVMSSDPDFGGSIANPLATMDVCRGEGHFVLTRQFSYPGYPQVRVYGIDSGRPVSALAFGNGEWLLGTTRRPD